MRAGYFCEDWAHRAFLTGLRDKCCPSAELIEVGVRGRSKQSLLREIRGVCAGIDRKGAGILVCLRDANDENWQVALAAEKSKVPNSHQHRTIYGVASRNVECWVVLDREHARAELGLPNADLSAPDPKGHVRRGLGARSHGDPEAELVRVVRGMSIQRSVSSGTPAARSLQTFCEDARDLGQRLGCDEVLSLYDAG